MRPVLNAICFNFKEDGLDVVSCNGQVLMKNHHLDIHTDKQRVFLLPPKPAALLRHFLCKEPLDICIKFTDSAAQFVGDTWQLTCRLIEGRYPNYNSVIPANNDRPSRAMRRRATSTRPATAIRCCRLSIRLTTWPLISWNCKLGR